MRKLTPSLVLAGAFGLVALSASAEENAAVSESAAPTFQEVERGGYAGTEFGFALTTVPGDSGKLATGSVLEVELGYDISSLIGIGVFVWGASLTSPGDAALPNGTAIGDFSSVFPGAELRLYLPIASDSNGVKRLFFDLRAGGGVMLFEGGLTGYPSGSAAPPSPNNNAFSGIAPAGRLGVSLEYFTRLRHFSIGLGLEAVAAAPGGSVMVGGSASPFARYSF
jgi:hypothetical protein